MLVKVREDTLSLRNKNDFSDLCSMVRSQYPVDCPDKVSNWVYPVPASNERMLQKSLSSESDALIYDLEDSVAPNEKVRARSSLLEFLKVGALSSRSLKS